jgi:hypothetical protein
MSSLNEQQIIQYDRDGVLIVEHETPEFPKTSFFAQPSTVECR